MNAFTKHGIDHLSASSCNLFAAEPALWVMEKLLGLKGKVGAAAHRGTAVERALALGLSAGLDVDGAVALGEAEFNKLVVLTTDPNREKEGEAVAGMIRQGYTVLQPYGKPTSTQRRIEWVVEDLPVPFVGYVDMEWDEYKILLELKTTLRCPSQISRTHARQAALYACATKGTVDCRVAYITPKRAEIYALENTGEHCQSLVKIGRAMERFLGVSSDPKELAGMIAPNIDSFYWSDPDTRQMAFEVYGV